MQHTNSSKSFWPPLPYVLHETCPFSNITSWLKEVFDWLGALMMVLIQNSFTSFHLDCHKMKFKRGMEWCTVLSKENCCHVWPIRWQDRNGETMNIDLSHFHRSWVGRKHDPKYKSWMMNIVLKEKLSPKLNGKKENNKNVAVIKVAIFFTELSQF